MIDKQPLISIIVPTRNRAQALSKCLQSLLQQNYNVQWYEIIVVDDGSIDDTFERVVQIKASVCQNSKGSLRYLYQPCSGANAARNRGIRESQGEIIVLIDDCYDIYRRLMDKNQMYEDVLSSNDSINTLLESILNITNILTWRETEIAFSRKIAQLLNVPMYTISVKHPDFMITRLISAPKESLNILYLSHAISVIRRQVSSARLSEFFAELSSFIKDILTPDNMVIFIPDTIDECRISQDDNGSNLLIPKLKLVSNPVANNQFHKFPLFSHYEVVPKIRTGC